MVPVTTNQFFFNSKTARNLRNRPTPFASTIAVAPHHGCVQLWTWGLSGLGTDSVQMDFSWNTSWNWTSIRPGFVQGKIWENAPIFPSKSHGLWSVFPWKYMKIGSISRHGIIGGPVEWMVCQSGYHLPSQHVNTIRLTVTKIPKICHKQYLNMAMSPRKGPEKLLVLSQVLPIKSPFLWENIRPSSTEISGSGPFHCRLQWQDLKNLWIKGWSGFY